MIYFISAVADQQYIFPVIFQQFFYLNLQRIPQIGVQRAERLIQKKQFRSADQNTRQRRSLLLSSGKLMRKGSAETCQFHHLQHIFQLFPADISVFFPIQPAKYVLFHRHIGKQRIILKKITYVPYLRTQIHMLFAVKKNSAVQNNTPLVRRDDPGDTFQRQAFAASGCSQKPHDPALMFQINRKQKPSKILFNVNRKTHDAPAFPFLRSSIFTISSTTVDIAILTSTQKSAPASSFVLHS